jgi:hypothetical protein
VRRHRAVECGLAGLTAIAAQAILTGCVATAAVVTTVVVVRMLTPYGYKLTIKAEQEPRELYNGLVGLLKQKHPDLKVLAENQPDRAFDAEWTAENGVEEWVSLVVQPLPDETSELVIAIGFGKKQRAEYKEWATERDGQMLDELDVEWKIASTDEHIGERVRLAGTHWEAPRHVPDGESALARAEAPAPAREIVTIHAPGR